MVVQNNVRARLKAGEVLYGSMIQDNRSPSIGQIFAQAGCDFLFFDMEHGPFHIGLVADLVKVTRLTGVAPLVRVPDGDYHLIARVMDAGAMGFMVPRVETREQVERIVDSALYPPKGSRGCSIDKGHNDFIPENMWSFTERKNEENLIIIQIERARAVEHIDELVSVEGVGAVILGPNDLALDMGERSKDQEAALEEPIQHVLDAALRHNVPCGIHIGNLDWLVEWQRRGMQLMAYATDVIMLRNGITTGLKRMREG